MNFKSLFIISTIFTISLLFMGCVNYPISGNGICEVGESENSTDCRVDLVTEIGNTIVSNNNTVLHTKFFNFEPNQVFSAQVFENKIDPCSLIFDTTDFSVDILATDGYYNNSGVCKTLVKNETSSQIRAKAVVVCAKDVQSLKNTLDNIENQDYVLPNDFIENGKETTKLCAIIFKRG